MPLHLAASYNSVDAARFLLDSGADVNAISTCHYGDTPLHRAASCGGVDVARLLVERVASIHATNEHGFTPLHSAMFHSME
jgi:ankyrin